MSKREKNVQRKETEQKSSTSNNNRKDEQQKQKGLLEDYVKDPAMIKVLQKKGIKKLFPIQYETFNLLFSGQDMIARDRTGSGKTLAFSLPIIMKLRQEKAFTNEHSPRFLVVLPTRELTLQVKAEIQSLKPMDQNDFRVGAVYGGSQIGRQIEMIRNGVDILVATPGRLIDLLNRDVINLSHLRATCLDEADQMLNLGFKEDIEKIFKYVDKYQNKKTQNLLFSATIPEWIWKISSLYQTKNCPYIDLIKDQHVQTSKNVKHVCVESRPNDKEGFLNAIILYYLKEKNDPKVIIFCETKRQVDRVGKSGMIDLRCEILHGDIKQFQREKVFRMFKKGEIDCLVATNVAARGLDFPQIDLIIQMEPPKTVDTYIHRSGRTGRAGKNGVCVTLFSEREENLMYNIEKEARIEFTLLKQKQLKPLMNQGFSNKKESNHSNREYPRDNHRGNESQSNSYKGNQRGRKSSEDLDY